MREPACSGTAGAGGRHGGPAAGIRASGAGDKTGRPVVRAAGTAVGQRLLHCADGRCVRAMVECHQFECHQSGEERHPFRGADCGCSARRRSVPPGLCPVPEVVANRGAAPAGCGAIAWEQFDASVQVSQGVLPIRCRQLSERNCTGPPYHRQLSRFHHRPGRRHPWAWRPTIAAAPRWRTPSATPHQARGRL